MLAPLQKSDPVDFSWLKIPNAVHPKPAKEVKCSEIPQGPLLVLLNYYSGVTSFNLSPVLHEVFNEHLDGDGIHHARVPRDTWRPEWDDKNSRFEIQWKEGGDRDHFFWRLIGCRVFEAQRFLIQKINDGIPKTHGTGNPSCSIPFFASNGEQPSFFSYRSNVQRPADPVDPVRYLDPETDGSIIRELAKISWGKAREFYDSYKENPLAKKKDEGQRKEENPESHLEKLRDRGGDDVLCRRIQSFTMELSKNQESIQKIVAWCLERTSPAKTALAESGSKLLEIIEAILNHTFFIAVGRFHQKGNRKAINKAFPVSVHVQVSFSNIHRSEEALFYLIPKDTPKVSKPNLSVDSEDEDRIGRSSQGSPYSIENNSTPNALSIPLIEWQQIVQGDHGYEHVFKEDRIHNTGLWNEIWDKLQGLGGPKGLKNGESEVNIGFENALYFFPPEAQIDVLYKSYQTAIKTVQANQGQVALSLKRLGVSGKDLPANFHCVLQDMTSKKAKNAVPMVSLSTHDLLKENQTEPDCSSHDTMVEQRLFRDQMNCFGLLKEQTLGGVGEQADHFGLNTHQRLFCHLALNGDPTGPGKPSSRQGISPLIALNGPPGTGKTTVLQAVVASEVVRSALTKTAMPIMVGASATHQAKSNIIGGFKHQEVHPKGTMEAGIWHRWMKLPTAQRDGEKRSASSNAIDYGLELESNTVSERLGLILDSRKSLQKYWDECFDQAMEVPLESPSQNALRARLNAMFFDFHQPEVQTHLNNKPSRMDALHRGLQQWWRAAEIHGRYAGKTIRQGIEAANAFNGQIQELSMGWKTLEAAQQQQVRQAMSKWLQTREDLDLELAIDPPELLTSIKKAEEETQTLLRDNQASENRLIQQLLDLQQEEAAWEKSMLDSLTEEAGEEWDAIASSYNQSIRFIPSVLRGLHWKVRENHIKETIKEATSKNPSKDVRRFRRSEYFKHLNHLQKRKHQADPFEIPKAVLDGIALPKHLLLEQEKLRANQERVQGELLDKKEADRDIRTLLDKISSQRSELERRHAEQLQVLDRLIRLFTEHKHLNTIGGILRLIQHNARQHSLDWRKTQACLEAINGAGPEAILSQAWLAITESQKMRRNALSLVDDIANILGAWVDNAYKPTCFHLAARWHEGKLLEEMVNRNPFKQLANRNELTRRLQMLARVYPVMVSTLHAIGNRMKIKEQETTMAGIGIIDLLIVDEAGQVPMNVGALGLLLSKRCLAVGDLDQLEPIWEMEAEDDTAFFRTLAGIPKEQLSPVDFAHLGWDCHASSLLSLVQKYTPWSPYDDTLQRGLYLLEHNRCPIEIISYCDALSYRGQLRCKITSHYREQNQPPSYQPFLLAHNDAWGGRLIDKMSLQQCQNRALSPNNPVPHPLSLVQHDCDDISMGSRTNEGEALAILDWLDQNFHRLTAAKGGTGDRVPIADRVAIITPFTAQAVKLFDMAKAFPWKNSGLKRDCSVDLNKLFNPNRKDRTTSGPNKTITIGTVHSLQGAEVDIVLFSNVYGKNSAGMPTFQDRNPQIMNVAVSRAKQAFVLFANRRFVEAIQPGQPSAVGMLVNQIRMLEQGQGAEKV